MFRTTGTAHWDGNAMRLLDRTPFLGLRTVAAAFDPDRCLYMVETSDDTGYSYTSPFDPTRPVSGYSNFDPARLTYVMVGLNRTRHGLAHDPVNHTMLAFGGLALGSGPAGTTFLWQTSPVYAWVPVTSLPQPPGRLDPQLTTDTSRSRIVLFGGRDTNGGPWGDTWEWNGQQWAQVVSSPAPSARWAAGFTHDPLRRVDVLHGGTDGSMTLADTWEWSGSVWTQRASSARGRQGHQLFFDPTRGRVLAWGGGSWREQQDMASWDGVQWTTLAPVTPLPCEGCGVATDTHRGLLVLFGGARDGAGLDDTWEWDGAQWYLRQPAHRPPPRTAAAMAHDPLRRRTVIHGGWFVGSIGWPLTDTWEWDGNDWTQIPNGALNANNLYPHLAFSPSDGGLVLVEESAYTGFGTFLLDAQGWRQLIGPANTPKLVQGTSALALHRPTGEVVLYGQENPGPQPNPWCSTWVLRNGAWVQLQAASLPGVIQDAALVEEPTTGDLLLVGADASHLSWRWNGSTWSADAPLRFRGGSGAVDPLRQLAVVFDGGMYRYSPTPLVVPAGGDPVGCHGGPGALMLRQLDQIWLGNPAASLAATNAQPGAPVAFVAAVPSSPPFVFQGCDLLQYQMLLGISAANGSGRGHPARPHAAAAGAAGPADRAAVHRGGLGEPDRHRRGVVAALRPTRRLNRRPAPRRACRRRAPNWPASNACANCSSTRSGAPPPCATTGAIRPISPPTTACSISAVAPASPRAASSRPSARARCSVATVRRWRWRSRRTPFAPSLPARRRDRVSAVILRRVGVPGLGFRRGSQLRLGVAAGSRTHGRRPRPGARKASQRRSISSALSKRTFGALAFLSLAARWPAVHAHSVVNGVPSSFKMRS
jgi:hypothetical protein